MPALPEAIYRLRPDLPHVQRSEQARSCAGALIGVAITGFVSRWALGSGAGVPLLVAPMGASAVLLFAAPSSPLAQPWSILGGNVISTLIGITVRKLVDDPYLAAALACATAIATMFLLDCLHPPGGASALVAVLGGKAVTDAGYSFALFPVGLNSVLLLASALAFNRAMGRRYPHLRAARTNLHGTADAPPTARLGPTHGDVEAVLAERHEFIDVAPDELQDILQEAESHALARRFGAITCGDIMSRDVATVTTSTTPREAWGLLSRHHIKALPVVDGGRRVVGIVTQTDFVEGARWEEPDGSASLRERVRRGLRLQGTRHPTVATLMTSPVRATHVDSPITELAPAMADEGLHHLPVVDASGMLVGIVTQSDLIAALYRVHLEHADGLEAAEGAAPVITTPSSLHQP